uniref:AP (Apurinic) endonuclease family 2 n=1 Tax=Pithovirus LCPAC404 TaxID=2506597 RepID=A0A481ZC26_9VIRU|nr:MAG: AP (apurinic) endonuclease family 2 [Pithovirus LCPAC404]
MADQSENVSTDNCSDNIIKNILDKEIKSVNVPEELEHQGEFLDGFFNNTLAKFDTCDIKDNIDISRDAIFGFHVRKTQSLLSSLKRIVENKDMPKFKAIQIYTSSPRSYKIPDISFEDLRATREYSKKHGIHLFIHACLLYNLCGASKLEKDKKYETKKWNTISSLASELDIAVALNAGLVVHTGSCVDKSRRYKEFSTNLVKSFVIESNYTSITAKILGVSKQDVIKKRTILLENSAGEGNKLGADILELSDMLNAVPDAIKSKIGFCIDTCHIYGSGCYDLSTVKGIDAMFGVIEMLIGIDRVKLIHLNDSKEKLGSRKDRHACLCEGLIWKDKEAVLKHLIDKTIKLGIPIIGEPPKNTVNDISLLERLELI